MERMNRFDISTDWIFPTKATRLNVTSVGIWDLCILARHQGPAAWEVPVSKWSQVDGGAVGQCFNSPHITQQANSKRPLKMNMSQNHDNHRLEQHCDQELSNYFAKKGEQDNEDGEEEACKIWTCRPVGSSRTGICHLKTTALTTSFRYLDHLSNLHYEMVSCTLQTSKLFLNCNLSFNYK